MNCIMSTKKYMKKKKDNLNKDGIKKFDYTKGRLTDDYLCESDQTDDKTLDKKEPPKKPTKSDVKEFNELINKEEMSTKRELFQNLFKFQMPSAMLKALYNTDSKKENNNLVDLIKSDSG